MTAGRPLLAAGATLVLGLAGPVRAEAQPAGTTPSADRVLLDKIVATVNQDIITLSELRKAARPYLEQNETSAKRKRLYDDVLAQLVNEKLIAQEIQDAKITATDEDVASAIEDILQRNGLTREQLVEAIEARGMSFDEYRSDIKAQLVRLKLVNMKVRSRVLIPEADLRAEYEIRTRDEPARIKVEIAHVFLRFPEGASEAARAETEAQAAALRVRIVQGGEPFAEVAKATSQGPTAAKGGGLGDFELGSLFPAFAKAIENLEPGQVSPPVPTGDGVHLVQLVARRTEKTRSFEDLRDKIYEELYEQRAEEQRKLWLDELRRSSNVQVRLDGVEP